MECFLEAWLPTGSFQPTSLQALDPALWLYSPLRLERLRFQFSEAEKETDLRFAAFLAAKWGKQLADAVPMPLGEPPQVTTSASVLSRKYANKVGDLLQN